MDERPYLIPYPANKQPYYAVALFILFPPFIKQYKT